MLEIIQIAVAADNYIYLAHDTGTLETAVIDPTFAEPVLDALTQKGWPLTLILNTHHHTDHVGGNLTLKAKTGCKIIAPQADSRRIPGIDQGVQDQDVILLGAHKIQVIATPGHTSGHIVYHFTEDLVLFCGDTLFSLGCGRLFEGSARELWASLQKIKALPPATRVYCAHEYTLANGYFALTVEPGNQDLQQRMIEVKQLRAGLRPTVPSTLGRELATNPFLREHSLEIQTSINKRHCSPVDVFTEIRRLKDVF